MNSLPAVKLMFWFVPQGTRDSSIHSILSLKILSSQSTMDSVSSDMAIQALNKELCFQWYIPPLERPPREVEPMVRNIITKLNLIFKDNG